MAKTIYVNNTTSTNVTVSGGDVMVVYNNGIANKTNVRYKGVSSCLQYRLRLRNLRVERRLDVHFQWRLVISGLDQK